MLKQELLNAIQDHWHFLDMSRHQATSTSIRTPCTQIKLYHLLREMKTLDWRSKPEFSAFWNKYENLLEEFYQNPSIEFISSHPEFCNDLRDLFLDTEYNLYWAHGYVGEPLEFIVADSAEAFHNLIVRIDGNPDLLKKELEYYPAIRDQLQDKNPEFLHQIAKENPILYYELIDLLLEKYSAGA